MLDRAATRLLFGGGPRPSRSNRGTFIFYNEINCCLHEGKFPIIVKVEKIITCTGLFHQPSTYNHQEEPGIL